MGENDLTITSTTDSDEDIAAALAHEPEQETPAKEAAKPADDAVEKDPPAKPKDEKPEPKPKAAAKQAADEDEEPDEVEGETKEQRRSRLLRRVDKLTFEKNRLNDEKTSERARADKLQTEIDALKAEAAAAKKPAEEPKAKAAEDPEPKEEDYATEGEYYRALSRWEGRQEARKIATEAESKRDAAAAKAADDARAAQEAEETAEIRRNFEKNREETRKRIPDLDEIMTSDAAKNQMVPPQAQYVFMTSAVGNDMMAHLVRNENEAKLIYGLKGPDMLRALGRLEGRIEKQIQDAEGAAGDEEEEAPKPKPKAVTQTSAPLKPVVGRAAGAGSTTSLDQMDYQAYKTERLKSMRGRNGR